MGRRPYLETGSVQISEGPREEIIDRTSLWMNPLSNEICPSKSVQRRHTEQEMEAEAGIRMLQLQTKVIRSHPLEEARPGCSLVPERSVALLTPPF